MNEDDYIDGLRDSAMTISCGWNPTTAKAFCEQWLERDVEYTDLIRFAGVDWWTFRTSFRAIVTDVDAAEDEIGATLSIVSPVVTVGSAWWRKTGHSVISRAMRLFSSRR